MLQFRHGSIERCMDMVMCLAPSYNALSTHLHAFPQIMMLQQIVTSSIHHSDPCPHSSVFLHFVMLTWNIYVHISKKCILVCFFDLRCCSTSIYEATFGLGLRYFAKNMDEVKLLPCKRFVEMLQTPSLSQCAHDPTLAASTNVCDFWKDCVDFW